MERGPSPAPDDATRVIPVTPDGRTRTFPEHSIPPSQPLPERPVVPTPIRRGRAPRRRRILLAAALTALVALVVSVVMFAYLATRLATIGRVSVSGLHGVGPGSPQTILLTGSDSRAGQTAAQAQQFGSAAQVAGQRSDVIVLIHLNPATGKAAMLSIPRDMFVPLAGTSSSNRINVAFDTSPSQLVATIEQDFGIKINHYAQEDFSGLQGVTNAVGGVCMDFPFPARDGAPSGSGNESGLNIPTAGRHTLDGAMGLALVRSRYYQYSQNGTWHSEGTGDIGRIQRQHSFMRALASKAIHSSLGNPFTANAVLGRAVHDVKVDTTFTTLGMIRLGLHLRSVHPSGMPSFTMPYRAVSNYRGFGDVLLPDPAQEQAVVAAWLAYGGAPSGSPTPSTVAPVSVNVRVLNGSGVAGQARGTADGLGAAGFRVAGFATAPTVRKGSTLVAYGPGLKSAAQSVAAHLGGPVTLQQDKSAGSAVLVTTGTGFTGVTGTAGVGSSSASTSAGPAPDNAVPPWDPKPC